MSDLLRIVVVIVIVGFVIGRQVQGEFLRGKRVVVLPAVLTVIGAVELGQGGRHFAPVDVGCLVVSAVIAAGIGLAQGGAMHLEARGGVLWGRMPARALWLWVLLVVSRLVITLAAHGLDAEVAGSAAPILMLLGINRLGQAGVVVPRAMLAGIPFAPEKDGKTFLSSAMSGSPSSTSSGTFGTSGAFGTSRTSGTFGASGTSGTAGNWGRSDPASLRRAARNARSRARARF